MSQETLELVIRVVRAAAKRPKPDFKTINALVDPDHVLVSAMAAKFGEAEAVGARGYKAWLEEVEGVMPFEMELEGAVDIAPNQVLAITTVRARGVSSEADTEQRMWSLVTVTDGKLTRTEVYLDPAEALGAAGLSE
jgi:ketosteroid isomerase-like protein